MTPEYADVNGGGRSGGDASINQLQVSSAE